MTAIIRNYAGANVPRYTSYPTAADFTLAVGPAQHAAWLGQLDPHDSVSLYLHVPYCRDMCLYCGCNTKIARRADVIDRYRRALEAEIDHVARLMSDRFNKLGVSRLHWGGGTPSSLGLDGLRSVVTALGRHFSFDRGFEHAIELDPRYVTAELATGLADLGVTRASLGIQDLDPLVQAAIGRIQPVDVVETAVTHLRQAGIDNLSFDLMYGLPLQTAASIRKTCASVAALAPNRISCFGYAHLPHLKANQRRIETAQLPSQDQRVDQADLIADLLTGHGYLKIGIDHFARPGDALARAAASGRLHRNFQGYTDDASKTLIGFGASAISTLTNGYLQNMTDVPSYIRAIEGGSLATVRGCPLDAGDRIRSAIIERLMCDFAVNLDAIAPNTDFADELMMLAPMASEGLLEISGRHLAMTEIGRPLVRVVAASFDTYRRPQAMRFSTAV